MNKISSDTTPKPCPDVFFDPPHPAQAGGKPKEIVAWSHYKEPVAPGALSGNSRRWGDIGETERTYLVHSLRQEAQSRGYSTEKTASLLALVAVESGFNPDAAAGTSSATGLGQFINKTGEAYGLDSTNRFSLAPQVDALFSSFEDDVRLAESLKKKGQNGDIYQIAYALHHDGPTLKYGGMAIAQGTFTKWRRQFQDWLTRLNSSCPTLGK